jgi:hypothetical protein
VGANLISEMKRLEARIEIALAIAEAANMRTQPVTQAPWFFAPQTGNDSRGGATPATAIKTFAEFERRVGEEPVFTSQATPLGVTLTFLEDQVDLSDPAYPNFNIIGDIPVTVQGTLLVVPNGSSASTLTAVTAGNLAPGAFWFVTDANLPAIGFAPFLDMLLVDLSQSPTTYAWIEAVLPGKQALLSQPFQQFDPTSGTLVPGIMAPGDSYQIQRGTRLNLLGATTLGPLQNFAGYLYLQNLQASPNFDFGEETIYAAGGTALIAAQCRFDGFVEGFSQVHDLAFNTCGFPIGGSFISAASIMGGYIRAGGVSVRLGQDAILDGGIIIDGTFIEIRQSSGSRLGSVGVRNPSDACLQLLRGSSARISDQGFGAALWGARGAQDAVHVGSGSRLLYPTSAAANLPIGGPFQLGGRSSNARAFDPAQGAGATYSAPIAAVLANLDVGPPAGFGGYAIDPEAMAGILLGA